MMKRSSWLAGLMAIAALGACNQNAASPAQQKSQNSDRPAVTADSDISAASVDTAYIANPGNGNNWPAIGYNYDGQRFSPLSAIDPENLKDLGIGWSADLPADGWTNSTPIAVDGRIYITTGNSDAIAFDAATGQKIWEYDSGPSEDAANNTICSSPDHEGAAISRGRLFFGTRGGRLIALDANTGALLWNSKVAQEGRSGAVIGAPVVIENKVIVGMSQPCPRSLSDVENQSERGNVTAFDVRSGQISWQFFTVPKREQVLQAEQESPLVSIAARSWPAVFSGAMTGGGFVPRNLAYDAVRGELLVGTGMRSDPPSATASSGDALFTSSLLAIEPETGRYLWHQQLAPSGLGWGANAPIIFASLPSKPRQDNPADEAQADVKSPPPVSASSPHIVLANGWLLAPNRGASKLLGAWKYSGGYSPVAAYEDGNALPKMSENGESRKTQAIHRPSFPASYSPKTGYFYLHRSNYQTADGVDMPAELIAFDTAKGKAAWSSAKTGPAMLVTSSNLAFAAWGAAFGPGFAAFDASTGKRLYFRSDFVPTGGAASFMADGKQMIAFPAHITGRKENRLIVMWVGGKEAIPPSSERGPGATGRASTDPNIGD